MIDQVEVSTEKVQEWVNMLDRICQSREIRKLIEQLARENHAYLQTEVKIEEE